MKKASKGEREKSSDEKAQQAVKGGRGARERRWGSAGRIAGSRLPAGSPKSRGDADTTRMEREAKSESHHERKEGKRKTHTKTWSG
jgi:hypothetical protein